MQVTVDAQPGRMSDSLEPELQVVIHKTWMQEMNLDPLQDQKLCQLTSSAPSPKIFINVSALPACMSVYCMYAWCLRKW